MTRIIDIKTEYGYNPNCLAKRPHFSWRLDGDKPQTAYRINVSASADGAERGDGELFDSGVVNSCETVGIEYGGKIASRLTCYFRVTAFFGDGSFDTSAVNSFSFGLLESSDWKGVWLSMPANDSGATSLYRIDKEIKDKTLVRATAYLCGLGFHEFFANGKKVGDWVLNPSITEYSERLPYVAYDILPYLQKGKNAFGIELGHGWFGAKALFAQFYFDYSDGETDELHSACGSGWWVSGSPTIENSIYGGEVYDARIEDLRPKNWASVDYTPEWDKGWMFTVYRAAPRGTLEPQLIEPCAVTENFPPVSITDKPNGVKIVDIGRNISGWARIQVRGARGSSITLKFAERLNSEGLCDRKNLRSAGAKDVYILKGEGVESYAPRFTYHGFQYIQVEFDGACELIDICAEHVHTATSVIGEFDCSVDDLNALHLNALVTEQNNQQGILTDCPQRDERFGWLNDLGSRLFQTVYNCDMSRFFPKFERDITHTQLSGGEIGDTAPFYTGMKPADPVCVVYALIPVLCYTHYGDKSVAVGEYDNVKRWVDYLLSRSDNFIMDYYYYGDWVSPDCYKPSADNIFVSTAYLFWHLKLMSKIAEIAGNATDKVKYAKLAEKSRASINAHYYNAAESSYSRGTQTENAIALSLGIVEAENVSACAQTLAKSVEAVGYHSTCGNIGYRHLFYALAKNGYADYVVKILRNPEYPGWGFMLASGATSVWERWECEMSSEMDSFDHPMFGSYDAFFYRFLGGIEVKDDAFACNRVSISPLAVKGIDRVHCALNTPRGRIVSDWRREGGKIVYDIIVPNGVTADIDIDGAVISISNSIYHFEQND